MVSTLPCLWVTLFQKNRAKDYQGKHMTLKTLASAHGYTGLQRLMYTHVSTPLQIYKNINHRKRRKWRRRIRSIWRLPPPQSPTWLKWGTVRNAVYTIVVHSQGCQDSPPYHHSHTTIQMNLWNSWPVHGEQEAWNTHLPYSEFWTWLGLRNTFQI